MAVRPLLALALAGLALAGCVAAPSGDPAEVTPTPGRSPQAGPTPPATPLPTAAGQTEVRGLDVRYVDADGRFRVLRVEDFPR